MSQRHRWYEWKRWRDEKGGTNTKWFFRFAFFWRFITIYKKCLLFCPSRQTIPQEGVGVVFSHFRSRKTLFLPVGCDLTVWSECLFLPLWLSQWVHWDLLCLKLSSWQGEISSKLDLYVPLINFMTTNFQIIPILGKNFLLNNIHLLSVFHTFNLYLTI